MRVASVREFRSNARSILKGQDVVLVTRHGEVSYIVVPTTMRLEDLPEEIRREVRDALTSAVGNDLRRRGVTEARLLRDFEAARKAGRAARRGR